MARTVGWLALGCAGLGRAGLWQGGGPVSARWAFDPGGSVRIMNPYGQIRVIGWDVDSLAVAGRLDAQAGRFYAAGDARVRKLGVEVPVEQRDAGKAQLEVRVPRRAAVWVKTATADIAVEGVDGTLDLNSVSGTIHVVGTPQDVTAETMDGSVEIAGGTGRVRVKTVSGGILLRGASEDLGASTLSGTIVVRAAGSRGGGAGAVGWGSPSRRTSAVTGSNLPRCTPVPPRCHPAARTTIVPLSVEAPRSSLAPRNRIPPLTVFTRTRPVPPAISTEPSIVSAVTSCGVPTTWIVPLTLFKSSVPSTPSTAMSAVAVFTHTAARRGTRTSSWAFPASRCSTGTSTPSLRTRASPAE